jgi:hypothetical protein
MSEGLLKITRASLLRSQANAMGSRAANRAFRQIANRRMTDTIVSLCKAYKDWQSEHGLYLGDVPEIPEHLEDGHLTTNEREWLRAFHSALERRLRPGKGERARRLMPPFKKRFSKNPIVHSTPHTNYRAHP